MKGILSFLDSIIDFLLFPFTFLKNLATFFAEGVIYITNIFAGWPPTFTAIMSTIMAFTLIIIILNVIRDVF